MMKKTVWKITLIWLVTVACLCLFGSVTLAETNAGRTSADFLQIGHGARAAGLGGAYTAVAEGAISAYWNP